jgi:tRNA (guanine-N(7)-)-methyltransferase subunit TRM82
VLTAENRLEYIQTLKLAGNALSVVVDLLPRKPQSDTSNRLLVSIDSIHKPGSTTEKREDADGNLNPLQSYQFQEGKLILDGTFQLATADPDEGEASGSVASGRLTNLLYSLENLRKREGEAQEE